MRPRPQAVEVPWCHVNSPNKEDEECTMQARLLLPEVKLEVKLFLIKKQK